MQPTISVIIPVYNRFELLRRAVESVLAQTVPVLEIILADDGSVDGTSDLLQEYIERNGEWKKLVRYVHQENQGPAAARNLGIAHARGEWLAFNDNDDLWLPQKLEWQLRALEQFGEQCGACFTDAWFMNNPQMKMTLFQLAGRQNADAVGVVVDPVKYLSDRGSISGIHPVWVQTLMVRASVAKRIGGFDAGLHCGEDDDFVFRLGCETKFCFVGMPMVAIERTPPEERHSGESKKWDQTEFRLSMAQRRFEKRMQMQGSSAAAIRKVTRKDLSATHSAWANLYLERGEYRKAHESATQAAKLHPTPGVLIKWGLTLFAPGLAKRAAGIREDQRRRISEGIA